MESYILGVGDMVNIMVYGEFEMIMKFIIDKSGVIIFFYIGKLMLKGKMVEQVGKEIIKKLCGYYL